MYTGDMKSYLSMSFRTEFPALFIIGLIALAAILLGNSLPEEVVTHWNIDGEADGWSPRSFVTLFFPLFTLGVYVLMLVIPHFDPKIDNYSKFSNAYHGTKTLIVGFIAAIFTIIVVNGMGFEVPVEFLLPPLVGLLLVGIGAHLPEVKQNWTFGIRSPWALSSERVWDKTHRLAGYLFIFGGTAAALSASIPGAVGLIAFFIAVMTAFLVPVAYSYFLFSRERRGLLV
jgi:uncharacterized membrane protein